MSENKNNEVNDEKIYFVAKASRSGYRVLINIPAEKRDKIEVDIYYKVYLIPIRFKDLE